MFARVSEIALLLPAPCNCTGECGLCEDGVFAEAEFGLSDFDDKVGDQAYLTWLAAYDAAEHDRAIAALTAAGCEVRDGLVWTQSDVDEAAAAAFEDAQVEHVARIREVA